jgi:divalent metal cation (Fe/Co/Zn/Cd) transporter
MSTVPSDHRPALIRRALRLEWMTVGWNVVEGIVAISAALAAGSVALLGFGVDSFVESTSGSVLIWRLHAERRARDEHRIEVVERQAERLVAATLFILAGYIAVDAGSSLLRGERPEPSPLGMALTALSLLVMWWLAREKKRTARALGSRAMQTDAFQTTACWWLSLIVLGGLAANATFGWWWADPVAALGATAFIVREGLGAWRGDDDCCPA